MASPSKNESSTPRNDTKPAAENGMQKKTEKKLPGTTSWWRAHRLELSIVAGILVIGTVVMWGYLVATGQGFLDLFGGTGGGTFGKKTVENVEHHLDGSPIAEGQRQVYPVAVMIENLPVVRPQAGLSQASIVYEAPVEGLTTRFLALFDLDQDISVIGPVRSARPYYVEWLSEYNALYAHAGGSPEALQAIDGFGLYDLNALYGNGSPYFYRDTSRYAPHNLFSSSQLLVLALRDRELIDKAPAYVPWKFEQEATTAPDHAALDTSATPDLTIDFSSASYQVDYYYDPDQNNYVRYDGGVPHTDANTGEPIRVSNAVAQIIPHIVSVGEKGRLTLDVHGSGRAVIAHDGQIVEGTWKKAKRTDRTTFFDADGNEIQFTIGSTWVAILPDGVSTVSYPGMTTAQ